MLIDVSHQDVDSFNYYLLYFTYQFSEDVLSRTPNTNIRYILYSDEVHYEGESPFDEYGFVLDDDSNLPLPMLQLPDELDGADDVDFCVALDSALDFFENEGEHDHQLLYWIPFVTHDDDTFSSCDDQEDALDDITTFAMRFRSDVDLGDWEQAFGDLDYCEYFEQPTYQTSRGNSGDVRYFTATLSDFVCLDGVDLTEAPTQGMVSDIR